VQYDSSSPEEGRGDGPRDRAILERGMRYIGEVAVGGLIGVVGPRQERSGCVSTCARASRGVPGLALAREARMSVCIGTQGPAGPHRAPDRCSPNDVIASARRSIQDLGVVSRRVGGVLLVVAATLPSAGSLAAREPCVSHTDDDRLTVHAEKVPLADVVREIGRQERCRDRGRGAQATRGDPAVRRGAALRRARAPAWRAELHAALRLGGQAAED